VKQAIDKAGIRPQADDFLPFQGGALGLFGYDLGRRLKNCPPSRKRHFTAGYGDRYL
jgi:para-aminobenzoate synthetase component 1